METSYWATRHTSVIVESLVPEQHIKGANRSSDMPEEQNCELLQTHRNTYNNQIKRKKRKKRKKKRRKAAPITPLQDTEKELSAQARESLKWEGVLEDPQAEETRLELYRANRRQRYIALREALLKEIQETQTDFS